MAPVEGYAPPAARASGPQLRGETGRERPNRNALECMRHDARSATHAVEGFLELLSLEALGTLSEEQRRALKHVETAAHRLVELAESALELAEAERPLRASEQASTCLVQLSEHILYGQSRTTPHVNISCAAADDVEKLQVAVESERLRKMLRILLDVALSTDPRQIDVRLSQTDLHASLVLGTRPQEGSTLRAVPSQQNVASSELDAMANDWSNREYTRLKRLENLLARHKGRLLVTPDLTRMRVMLPLAR